MKIKKVLGVVALLSSMPFAFNANNLTHVVCAADVETTTIAAIKANPENDFYYLFGDNFKAVDGSSDGAPSDNATAISLYGGDYIETINPVSVLGGTKVNFAITMKPSKSESKYNKTAYTIYVEVYKAGSSSPISSISFYPKGNSNLEYNSATGSNFATSGDRSIAIAETGDYHFRISSSSGSSSKNHNKFKACSFTYTPYVAAPEEPDVGDPVLPDQRTLSQMAFSYSKNDEGAYSIGDVVLRYGAVLPYVDWSALDINAYGVALTKSSNLEGSLSDLIGSTDLSDPSARAGFDKVSFAMGDMDNVARVNADGDLFVEDAEGEYVLFNARLSVPSSNYHTEINAVVFVVVAGKTVLFEEVVGDSVASQARYYLDNGSYSGDVYDVLNILAA